MVMQFLGFWVVPLAMDLILGLPWLQKMQPAIDWDSHHVWWEYDSDVTEVFKWKSKLE